MKRIIVVAILQILLWWYPSHASVVVAQGLPRVPRLSLVRVDSTTPRAPRDHIRPIALGPRGEVLVVSDLSYETHLALLPSSGAPPFRFGRPGGGPGEVRNPLPFWIGDSVVSVFDIGNPRITQWGMTGGLVTTIPLSLVAVPVGTPTRTIGLRMIGPGRFAVIQIDAGSGEVATVTTLVPLADSFLSASSGAGTMEHPRYAPVLGYWAQGFIVADPNVFALGLYDWTGKLVRIVHGSGPRPALEGARLERLVDEAIRLRPAAERPQAEANRSGIRRDLQRSAQPFFSAVSPIGTDGHGRFWVFSQRGDSAQAQVFSDHGVIGTVPVGCPQFAFRAVVRGEWVAMVCGATSIEVGASLRLFRIVEQ